MDDLFFKTDDVVIEFTGAKTPDLLHGQLTNDIKSLAINEANFNLLLDRKGKVQALMYVLHDQEQFKIIISKLQADRIVDHFKMLAPLSRVVIKNNVDTLAVYHVFCAELLQNSKLETFKTDRMLFDKFLVCRTDRYGVPGVDVLVPSEQESHFKNLMQRFQFKELSLNDVEWVRIKHRRPKYGVDVTEQNLPQEAGLQNALHFKKGCYLGQEVIARLHYRGHVNKVLQVFEVDCDIQSGDEINIGTDQKSRVCSSAFDPDSKHHCFLAYVPNDISYDQIRISIRNQDCRVHGLKQG